MTPEQKTGVHFSQRAYECMMTQARAEARAAALEEAAKFAENWLKDWGADLAGTRDAYIEARSTGLFSGRRIKSEDAKAHARDFGMRADAVFDCGEPLAAALRALIEESP